MTTKAEDPAIFAQEEISAFFTDWLMDRGAAVELSTFLDGYNLITHHDPDKYDIVPRRAPVCVLLDARIDFDILMVLLKRLVKRLEQIAESQECEDEGRKSVVLPLARKFKSWPPTS